MRGDGLAEELDIPRGCMPDVSTRPYTTTPYGLGSVIRHADRHAPFNGKTPVTRAELRELLEVTHTMTVGTEQRSGTSRRAPSARMMLLSLFTGDGSENYVSR